MKRFLIILFTSLLIFLISCSDSTTETSSKELLNNVWVMESFEVNGIIEIPPSNQVYNIKFNEDSSLAGESDCNSLFGTYILNSNSLTINNLITTEVYCGKESMDFRYFDALRRAVSYKIDNNKLSINYGENSKLNFVVE